MLTLIACSYYKGVFTRETAWEIAYYRGKLSASLAHQRGAMMAVGLGIEEARDLVLRCCKQFPSVGISIACDNSPRSVTVSGDEDQILALKALLDQQGIFSRKLQVEIAYHSHHMMSIAQCYREKLGELTPSTAANEAPLMISTVTGTEVSNMDLCQGSYWVQNLISPILFTLALTKLGGTMALSTIVEIGPHAALRSPIHETIRELPNGQSAEYHSCLLRNTSASKSLLETLGRIFCSGISMILRQINQPGKASSNLTALCDLPAYSFDHSRTFWKEGRLSRESRF